MSEHITVNTPAAEYPAELAERTVNDLVAAYPDLLSVLAPLGIDLCCGGAHPLGVALDLHGIERQPVLAQVAAVVAGSRADGEGR